MEQSVYIFGQMAVKSYDDYFTQYGLPFLPILEKFNGKLLAATKNGRTLEGDAFGNLDGTNAISFKGNGLRLCNF